MSKYTSDIEDIAQALYKIADTLRYAVKVMSFDDCNTCEAKNCKYRPKWGQMVRINCPLWKGDEA